MAKIYQIPTQIPGTVGVSPNQRFAIFGDNLATVTAPGYLNAVQAELNNLSTTDVIVAFYDFNLNTQAGSFDIFTIAINGQGVITLTGTGTTDGSVSAGLANQLAYYAANGTTVSGLATANSSVLVTSAGGVPSLSTTLPSGLAMQTPASIVLTNGTALPVTGLAVGANSAMVVTNASGVASATASMTNLQVVGGITGGTPKPFTLVAGDGVTITQDNGASTITVSATGFAWSDVVGTTQQMVVNKGYVASNASLVTLTLPATSAIGDRIAVQDSGLGGWTIAQNAGQTIRSNGNSSTTGVAGSLSSGQPFDVVYLLCTVANTEWAYNGGFGNYVYA